MGWFSSGRDKAARDLFLIVHEAIHRGEIKAEVAFIFCDSEPGETRESDLFIEMAQDHHLSPICFSYRKFKSKQKTGRKDKAGILPSWRLNYDREVMESLANYHPDLCVLAGYMLIVGPEMCRRYNMINLHPAAPGGPTGTWQEVVWNLIDSGATKTGVMMHLVTPELDKGPPVAYCTFSIRGEPFDNYWREIQRHPIDTPHWYKAREDLFHLIRKHGLAREFPLIVSTIKAFSDGKIDVNKQKQVMDAASNPMKGYDLTKEIDAQVASLLISS